MAERRLAERPAMQLVGLDDDATDAPAPVRSAPERLHEAAAGARTWASRRPAIGGRRLRGGRRAARRSSCSPARAGWSSANAPQVLGPAAFAGAVDSLRSAPQARWTADVDGGVAPMLVGDVAGGRPRVPWTRATGGSSASTRSRARRAGPCRSAPTRSLTRSCAGRPARCWRASSARPRRPTRATWPRSPTAIVGAGDALGDRPDRRRGPVAAPDRRVGPVDRRRGLRPRRGDATPSDSSTISRIDPVTARAVWVTQRFATARTSTNGRIRLVVARRAGDGARATTAPSCSTRRRGSGRPTRPRRSGSTRPGSWRTGRWCGCSTGCMRSAIVARSSLSTGPGRALADRRGLGALRGRVRRSSGTHLHLGRAGRRRRPAPTGRGADQQVWRTTRTATRVSVDAAGRVVVRNGGTLAGLDVADGARRLGPRPRRGLRAGASPTVGGWRCSAGGDRRPPACSSPSTSRTASVEWQLPLPDGTSRVVQLGTQLYARRRRRAGGAAVTRRGLVRRTEVAERVRVRGTVTSCSGSPSFFVAATRPSRPHPRRGVACAG